MSGTALLGLLENAILLLALVVLYDAFPARSELGRRGFEVVSGGLIGLFAIVLMLNPLRFSPGVIFDTRSVLLSASGLFFGAVPTVIASVVAAAWRLYQGGAGAWTGVGVIAVSAGLGLLWSRVRGRWFQSFRLAELYVFGLVVNVAMLLMMLTLPDDAAVPVLRDISAPVLVIYPIATVLIGQLLVRRRAQRRDHNLLQTVIETGPVGIVVMDGDGTITLSNARAEHVLGLSSDEIAGRAYNAPEWRVTNLDGGPFPDDELPFRRVVRSGRPVSDVRHAIRVPDGRTVLLSINAAPLLDEAGVPAGVVTSIEDITEHSRNDQRIEHLNRVLRATRSIGHLAINERDPDALMQGTCDLLVEHRGYDAVSVFVVGGDGVPTRFAYAGPQGAKAGLAELVAAGSLPPCCREAGRRGGSAVMMEAVDTCDRCPGGCGRSTGETVCIELRHGGTTYGYVSASTDRVVGIDLEERELLEAMAADVAFALHSTEQDRAIVLAREERDRMEANLRQAQKMEAVGRLAGGVAHDFNNMLSVIIGNADLALAGLRPEDPVFDELQQIERAARRSADLTRQLLAFSRKQIVSPLVVNLNETIGEQLRLLSRLIGENIEVGFAPAADLWPVWIDPAQVDQILANLTVNARDSISGTGAVTIETRNRVVGVAEGRTAPDKPPGDYVELSFADTGVGMDRETLDRIFEPFFTTKDPGEGTGLGLSTVYGIVQQNRGFIEVESEPGGGTAFRVCFPRSRLERVSRAADPAIQTATGDETVLVVEDESSVLRLTRLILERSGYVVLTAQTPAEATRLLGEYEGPLHLLLTDVIMPGMNGVELRDTVAAMRPGIRTLFMSGYSENVVAHGGVVESGIHFIEKPFSAAALAQKVRSILDT
ncbi:MAG: LytS/YhcK type 5TM receptor domain-containing protein [Thermoleophilia bacterium]